MTSSWPYCTKAYSDCLSLDRWNSSVDRCKVELYMVEQSLKARAGGEWGGGGRGGSGETEWERVCLTHAHTRTHTHTHTLTISLSLSHTQRASASLMFYCSAWQVWSLQSIFCYPWKRASEEKRAPRLTSYLHLNFRELRKHSPRSRTSWTSGEGKKKGGGGGGERERERERESWRLKKKKSERDSGRVVLWLASPSPQGVCPPISSREMEPCRLPEIISATRFTFLQALPARPPQGDKMARGQSMKWTS